ncbi:Ig-like domain-containing protein [Lentisalinibacter sediminis]|uniref:Ig-like domain-containing protein n=1 Tax=Lentisalinibacter sediminis TaxID=2992237 RepID=UPI00386E25CC
MTIRRRWRSNLVAALAIAGLLAGCGGGGGNEAAMDASGPDGSGPAQNTLPTLSFLQPAQNTEFDEGDTAHVIVDASDSDGTVVAVSLSLNGVVVREQGASPFEWGAPGSSDDAMLRNLAPGDYTLSATATDDAGGETTTTRGFTVVAASTPPPSNTGPTASFSQPANGAIFDEGGTAFVVVDATDNDGTVANVRLLLDGTLVRQENVAPYEWGAPGDTNDAVLRNLEAGQYTLTAIATDDDGAETSIEIMFTVQAGDGGGPGPSGACAVSGDLIQWHRVVLSCTGVDASESDAATFADYRVNVTFSQGGTSLTVPGHFAADGNAADTGAGNGDVWRAYFAPPATGTWQYAVSFRTGSEIAVNLAAGAGTPVAALDGKSGQFDVSTAPAPTTDMRTRGLLEHRDGERYLRFAGDDSIFIAGGMDSPENIFGYSEIDNTTKFNDAGSCKGILHDFAPHGGDWNAGDPTWGNDERGKSLIGLINYIASTGVNAIYVMANTVRGDGCDAHPWLEYNASGDERRFDVSKLDQWERAFGHMTAIGILIHVVTQETENDQLLNGGDLGIERQLYYRELVSRFGHHPALQWNLGEENTNTPAQQRAFADFIRAQDPYDHPIFMHTFPGQTDRYDDLLGHPTVDGPTIQFGAIPEEASAANGVYATAASWIERSTSAGKPWVVTFTEASGNDAPTPNTSVTSRQRIYWMWASVMSGGGGFEWYLKNDGAGHAYDLAVEDLREFDAHWQQSGHLVRFFRDIVQGKAGVDLQSLEPSNDATDTASDWVLADSGSAYIIYLRQGGGTNINLSNNASYDVTWFNPRTGTETASGSIQGPGIQSIGTPPSEASQDWAVLVGTDGDSGPGSSSQVDAVIVDGEGNSTLLQSVSEGMSITAAAQRLYQADSGYTSGYDANNPETIERGMVFDKWYGDIAHLSNRFSETTTIINVDQVDNPEEGLIFVALYRLEGIQSSDSPGGDSWKDSVSVFNQSTQRYECYCDSNGYDHGIGDYVPIGQTLTVQQICEDLIGEPDPADVAFSEAKGIYKKFNDIQCGNGPANNAGDEDFDRCAGIVTEGSDGCTIIGPKWSL